MQQSEPSITAMCRELRIARELREDLEARAKDAKATETELESALFARMQDEDLSNLTLDGVQFVRTTRNMANAVAERKTDLFAALRANGRGDIIQQTVNANTLSATVNEAMDANGCALPDWLDGLVNLHAIEHVAIKRR